MSRQYPYASYLSVVACKRQCYQLTVMNESYAINDSIFVQYSPADNDNKCNDDVLMIKSRLPKKCGWFKTKFRALYLF